MRRLPDNSVDAIVTDPPAGIAFMGRSWDRFRCDFPPPDFLNWFAGFVDGEGCFSVHKKNVSGYETYDCQFSIGLRRDDAPILREIKRVLGIGTVAVSKKKPAGGGNPKARFCVSSKADCLRLVEVFRAAPLRAKKARDFEFWVEALDAWIRHQPKDWREMADARTRLMESRQYTEHGKCAGPPARREFVAWMTQVAKEMLRVSKPGSHALVWSLPRTSHWTATALEKAGWEIRDCIAHITGQGFPKSLDASKAIDCHLGAEGKRKFKNKNPADRPYCKTRGETSTGWQSPPRPPKTHSATKQARKWEGFGTALKPAIEYWILARKPLEGTVAANLLKHGTGAINVDGCRVQCTARPKIVGVNKARKFSADFKQGSLADGTTTTGRWPANLVLDEDAARALDEQSGISGPVKPRMGGIRPKSAKRGTVDFKRGCRATYPVDRGDTGGASRYFYCAKASRRERGEGNKHPTVKPLKLMQWLVRLVTPPKGVVLDPFMGSGTTGIACAIEGFHFIGADNVLDYVKIAACRIAAAKTKHRVSIKLRSVKRKRKKGKQR
jgi:site-specific DNA-methyltransferase (adenine-specific)